MYVGENESFYTIFPATVRNAGQYYCEVINQYGVINSSTATVTVTYNATARHPSVDSTWTYCPNLASHKKVAIQDTTPSANLKSLLRMNMQVCSYIRYSSI